MKTKKIRPSAKVFPFWNVLWTSIANSMKRLHLTGQQIKVKQPR